MLTSNHISTATIESEVRVESAASRFIFPSPKVEANNESNVKSAWIATPQPLTAVNPINRIISKALEVEENNEASYHSTPPTYSNPSEDGDRRLLRCYVFFLLMAICSAIIIILLSLYIYIYYIMCVFLHSIYLFVLKIQ